MDVSGIGAAYGPSGIRSAGPIKPTADVKPGSPVTIPQDVVEISSAGRLLDQAVQSNPVREQRLEQIRAAIAEGTYDTDEKLEQALNRMLASFDESA